MRSCAQQQPQSRIRPATFNAAYTPADRSHGSGEQQKNLTGAEPSHAAHHFSRISSYPSVPGRVQAKLTINTPGDTYEQEADRTADQIMRMPDSSFTKIPSAYSAAPNSEIHLKCAECEKEEEEQVQRSAAGSRTTKEGSGHVPDIVGTVLRSPGKRLDNGVRSFMEPRFGADFSSVRIHADDTAAKSAQAIHAHAYTLGDQIVFNRGRYTPATKEGRRLIAHELTHVIQQRGGRASTVSEGRTQGPRPAAQGTNVSGKSLPSVGATTNSLQRQEQEGDGRKPEQIGSEKANSVCEPPCGNFPWFEVAPGRFFSLCDDTITKSGSLITTAGCPPGGSGNVTFVSGSPAWSLANQCSTCSDPSTEKKPLPKIEVGYIQTVEKVLSGGVYYKRNAQDEWDWADNEWRCVSNARDGHQTSTAPWFGPDASGNFGPQLYPNCPSLMDNPFVKLPSHKGGGSLRRMRIDGIFHIWLVAKPPSGPLVFIHHWDIELWVVAMLADDGHPCNLTAWRRLNGTTVRSKGPGKGSATPVLTGKTANELQQPC